ncbi:MAG: hypothetical protein IJI09_09280 [Clostridia bacterium]|nr:hypothetical protein [Clostridia bacterium]
MKKIFALALMLAMLCAVCCAPAEAEESRPEEGPKFVTIREWLDAEGECGDCMVLLRIRQIINPVLAIGEDETGTIDLYSGGEDRIIINFTEDDIAEGDFIVIANPKYNPYEGKIEMTDWILKRILPKF